MQNQWWNTSAAAWGLLFLGIGVAVVLTYVESPLIGITIGIIICLAGIAMIIRAYHGKSKAKISLKKGANKMLIGFSIGGIVVCIGAIVGCVFLIKSQLNVETQTTVVYCCTRDNIYQVWADNRGDDKDTVFVTLGTGGLITDFRATMGASLPNIIEGGKNANFITFKIEQLPPNVSLNYLVYVSGRTEQPYKFTAWSEVTKNNISVKFVGECPKIIEIGPVEKAP